MAKMGHNYREFYGKGVEMQVSLQEFKLHFAQYVAQAQGGQVIELTSHSNVVARLVGGGSRLLVTALHACWQVAARLGKAASRLGRNWCWRRGVNHCRPWYWKIAAKQGGQNIGFDGFGVRYASKV
jgi:prevent-host-death family protein